MLTVRATRVMREQQRSGPAKRISHRFIAGSAFNGCRRGELRFAEQAAANMRRQQITIEWQQHGGRAIGRLA
jgi:hypothetical protein